VAGCDFGTAEQSGATLTIKTASFDSGVAYRDQHLLGAGFLDADTYPEIRFESSTVSYRAQDEVVVTGDLTVRGVTRPVEITWQMSGPVTDQYGADRVAFHGELPIKRSDFGITWSEMLNTGGAVLSDRLTIELDIEATPAAADAESHS